MCGCSKPLRNPPEANRGIRVKKILGWFHGWNLLRTKRLKKHSLKESAARRRARSGRAIAYLPKCNLNPQNADAEGFAKGVPNVIAVFGFKKLKNYKTKRGMINGKKSLRVA
jgi:hypothetical protein